MPNTTKATEKGQQLQKQETEIKNSLDGDDQRKRKKKKKKENKNNPEAT